MASVGASDVPADRRMSTSTDRRSYEALAWKGLGRECPGAAPNDGVFPWSREFFHPRRRTFSRLKFAANRLSLLIAAAQRPRPASADPTSRPTDTWRRPKAPRP